MIPTRRVPSLPRPASLATLFATALAGCTDAPQPTGPAAPRGLRPSIAAVATATNGKLAFVSFRDGNGEIYVMNADGSGQTRLTNNPAEDRLPAWSPDGTKIAFSRNFFEIYVMNADGSGQTQLTNHPFNDFDPDWSPDGTKIAYTCGGDVCLINVDGSGRTDLTNTFSVADGQPDWSPDGTKIAFVSTFSPDIYVMNADGSGLTRLTNQTGSEPDWSPDGTKIAFESHRDGNKFEIYVMNTDGSAQSPLTTTLGHSLRPAWSPDGTKLAFQSSRDGNPEIYVMNADGSEQTRLTNNPAWDGEPAWQTLPSDLEPPVLTVPANMTVEATSPAGAAVTYSASATDNIDPAPVVSCASPSGATFPLGSTVVTCTATDAAGNTGTASFIVTVVDTTPPVLSLPADFAVDATSPSATVVSYTVTALDAVSIPTVSCSPASGSLFAIGTHTVSCTATDAAGNSTAAAFDVTVKGATEQIGDLQGAVTDLHLPQGTETSIKQKLTAAAAALALGDRDGACDSLESLISHVNAQSGKKISAADAAVLIAEAERIRAVLGC